MGNAMPDSGRDIENGQARTAWPFVRAAGRFLARLRRDSRGNILVIFAVALPMVIGALGLGVEAANWHQTKQSLQNAADEAAVAAATNASSNYLLEARAVAAKYGYTDGVSNVTVTASNSATCPDGTTACYSVTISKKLPLFFTKVVGFTGNATVGAANYEMITETGVAIRDTSPRNYCVLALATSGAAIALQTNGAPKADLSGCSIMSNTGMDCNGHDLNADYGDAHGTNSGCGNATESNLPTVPDPYAALASNIPANPCASYPQAPTKKNGAALPSSNLLTGSVSYSSAKTFCGDVQLTGDVTLTGTDNVIVLRNGDLDLNGHSITTATGAAATIIFSGDSEPFTHIPKGSGTINIAAPTSGTWSGVALYQDPALTTGLDISAAGNSPSWNITGLAYFPHAAVEFSGAVGKSTNGKSCFVMVVDTLLINGTGSILNRGECDQAGLTMPTGHVPIRGRLVA
jgi:Flp pilus assembly protein TadG